MPWPDSRAAARGSMGLPVSQSLVAAEAISTSGMPASCTAARSRYAAIGDLQMLPVQTVRILYMWPVYARQGREGRSRGTCCRYPGHGCRELLVHEQQQRGNEDEQGAEHQVQDALPAGIAGEAAEPLGRGGEEEPHDQDVHGHDRADEHQVLRNQRFLWADELRGEGQEE